MSNHASGERTHASWRSRCRFGGRFTAGLVGAIAAVGAVAVPVAGPVDDVAAVGTVSTSSTMVEMLGNGSTANPIYLSDVRSRVEASLDDPTADGGGVDVAVIDTGVAPVAGLDGSDKVLHGPDLSFESSDSNSAFLDTYGHGTHMAGIIAGARSGHEGIAPGARIVSLKVAGHDGQTTVPQVVAAIDWVVEHRNTDGLNIRVLNLSLGQQGVTDHTGDLLSAAVERAWNAGIFVVVAAGNSGQTEERVDSPAIDPYIMAVGAEDGINKIIPTWSATGDGDRDPDVVAVGQSIASYRVPGSTVDSTVPSARIGTDLFLGSGTSQSAAVVSGLAARILDAEPQLTPDQLKATLSRTAEALPQEDSHKAGDGMVSGNKAEKELLIANATQTHTPAAGGETGIVTPTGGTWSGGTWSGATWSGSTWSGATWSGGTWSGATWSGGTWSGATWSGATWSGGTWSGGTWSGATWSGATWSGGTWSGNGWN